MEFVQPIRERKKIDAMKKLLKGSNIRDYVLFTLGINSGLRVSDLLQLKVADVIDEKGRIRDRITIREKKTGKTKTFPFSDTVIKALREYVPNLSTGSALFPSRKGRTPITRQQAYRILNDAAKVIGVKDKIGTHTLRKTFAYHAYISGVDVTRIQALLNHSSPRETLRYIGITQDELDDVYLNLNL
ncbi:site-specific integrase [Desulfitobacterium metallireducens]|uniref:Integrase n=1 Tax=Desulfitobacterium metallireducens DSM 15288 TaxID=871968 RepID=W0EC14_9FIRM|nr:site-specific integrase [Desulfitobacterium metallireducens]AHF07078.1 integrase [Desulfitobacterium metallireducens DSM 15288]